MKRKKNGLGHMAMIEKQRGQKTRWQELRGKVKRGIERKK
jgi:hypothetical protein